MNRGKMPLRLAGLEAARAHWSTMHPEDGELPACFTLDFRDVTGPVRNILGDGRLLRASITPAELAEALSALPALSLTGDDDDLRALMRVIRLLRPEPKEGT
jgi:hypothetical protein